MRGWHAGHERLRALHTAPQPLAGAEARANPSGREVGGGLARRRRDLRADDLAAAAEREARAGHRPVAHPLFAPTQTPASYVRVHQTSGPAAPAALARHAGVVGVVGALLGFRPGRCGVGPGDRAFCPSVRHLRGFWVASRAAGPGSAGDPRRRPGLAHRGWRDADARATVSCAPSSRCTAAGARAAPRPRPAAGARDRPRRRPARNPVRASRIEPAGGARERSRGHDRDGRHATVPGKGRPARERSEFVAR